NYQELCYKESDVLRIPTVYQLTKERSYTTIFSPHTKRHYSTNYVMNTARHFVTHPITKSFIDILTHKHMRPRATLNNIISVSFTILRILANSVFTNVINEIFDKRGTLG